MINNLNLLLRKNFILIIFFFSISHAQPSNDLFTVVLDAGHGGKDPGNRGNGYYEKHIALNIALGVGEILKKDKQIRVIYTRTKDEFVNLFDRAKIANDSNADLFISIHCDAHNSNAYGAGTFVLGLHANERNFQIAKKENSVIFLEEDYVQKYDGFDPNNPESVISLVLMQEEYLDQSIIAANLIQESFTKNLNRKNRTVKQAGFIVLKYTYMPSVLVETGFLTNKTEGKYLNSRKGQTEMSRSIANAIIDYKNKAKNAYTELGSGYGSEKKSYDTYFKVQIASGSRFLDLKPYNFKGLNELSYLKSGKSYKYFYERTERLDIAKQFLKKAKKVGFKDALVVAFKNGKQISMSEVYLKDND